MDELARIFSNENDTITIITNLLILLSVAFTVYYIFRLILKNILRRFFTNLKTFNGSTISNPRTLQHLSRMVPTVIIQIGIVMVPNLDPSFTLVVRNVATGLTLLHGMLAMGAFLDSMIDYFTRKQSTRLHSIKSYIQLAKIILYVLGAICIIAIIIDRSPVILISGLGAMSAITMLVFKDTILSFVAGIQIASNDMLRLGDWIEMPQVGADGDVVDIALHTIKIQNFDKTITTIPTWRLISESFRNWRGMQESGGRRIKRAINIDATSVKFMTSEELKRLSHVNVLKDYLDDKHVELEKYNSNLGESAQMDINRRRLTNIGTFRAYAQAYLRSHPRVSKNMTCMVRLLAPETDGLPIEIYCFSNTVVWTEYEGIQGDIFDHLISILPEFNLRIYQHPSGHDMSLLVPNSVEHARAAIREENLHGQE